MNYSNTQVKSMLELLNGMTVTGIENAKRIAMIATMLENPEKENDDGSNA